MKIKNIQLRLRCDKRSPNVPMSPGIFHFANGKTQRDYKEPFAKFSESIRCHYTSIKVKDICNFFSENSDGCCGLFETEIDLLKQLKVIV